jgi:hypothetical protein
MFLYSTVVRYLFLASLPWFYFFLTDYFAFDAFDLLAYTLTNEALTDINFVAGVCSVGVPLLIAGFRITTRLYYHCPSFKVVVLAGQDDC